MRRLATILACLALASCWYGDGLYTPSDARPAVAPGVYRATIEGETPQTYRVSMLANGMTQFDSGEKKETYGFAPLDSARGTYVLWIPLKDEDAAPSDERGEPQIYLLAVRLRDGEFRIYPPQCKGAAAEIARKSGAAVESGSAPACRFGSRADLEKGMRLLPRDDASASTLVRIP